MNVSRGKYVTYGQPDLNIAKYILKYHVIQLICITFMISSTNKNLIRKISELHSDPCSGRHLRWQSKGRKCPGGHGGIDDDPFLLVFLKNLWPKFCDNPSNEYNYVF